MNINHVLRYSRGAFMVVFGLLCLFQGISVSWAQDVKAMPVAEVTKEKLKVIGNAPVVVELFSSQACVFCPEADRLFADIANQDNVIGLACHIDYYDVKQGSLARKFCSDRQSWYMENLFNGPNYTPQMVVNGTLDVVGYKFEEVVGAIQQSSQSSIKPLEIVETDAKGTYKVALPLEDAGNVNDYKLWMAVYDKPHKLKIADGLNKGKTAVYYNIVSDLGSTDSITDTVYVTPPVKPAHAGFAVILQNMVDGHIHAVGKHSLMPPPEMMGPFRPL